MVSLSGKNVNFKHVKGSLSNVCFKGTDGHLNSIFYLD